MYDDNTHLTSFSVPTCLLCESHNCNYRPLGSFNYFQVIISIKLIFCTLVFDWCRNNQTHKLIHTRTDSGKKKRVKISLETLLQEEFQGGFSPSKRAPAFLQPVSCHNTYLPGEKLHLKDLSEWNCRRAHGWPGTIKRGGKNEINTERGGQGLLERKKAVAEMAQWDTKTAWEAVQQWCRKTPGDGQTQHHPNFHFSVCNPRWLGRNDGYSNWPFASPVLHYNMSS